MTHHELVARLKALREDIERDGDVPIAALETPFALALSDVCVALGLAGVEHDEVLGCAAAAYLAAVRDSRAWPAGIEPGAALPAAALPTGEGLCR
jgi:hypothetical protein